MGAKTGLIKGKALLAVALGGSLGFACAWALPRRYFAESQLYFPTLNVKLYVQLTQALQVNPGEDNAVVSLPAQDSQVSQVARLVLTSRAAAQFALKKAGLPVTNHWFGLDSVESFRKRIEIQLVPPSALLLRVHGYPADTARSLCQALMEYYSTFTSEQSLTHTARTQKRVQVMIDEVGRNLYELEGQLTVSGEDTLRTLGDAAIQADEKVMRQLWKKRLDQAAQSRKVLENLRKIRGDNEDGPDLWVSQWAPTRPASAPKGEKALDGSVRRQDLAARVKLEREYEDALTVHRALVLQNAFLQTWAALEDHDFEVVDPVSVQAESPLGLAMLLSLLGAGLGGGIFILTRLLRR